MSQALTSGLFGLGGVLLGGVITMGSTALQSASARRTRIAELELQLQNERRLRAEATRQTALLELIAAAERISNSAYLAGRGHDHRSDGQWPDKPCQLTEMSELPAAAKAFNDLCDRNRPLISNDVVLDWPIEIWESITLTPDMDLRGHYYDKFCDNRSDYCRLGAKLTCLEVAATAA